MNTKKSDKIVYISSVDVSLGNGPGVNEREFIISISNLLKDKILFLIPKPKYKIEDSQFPFEKCIFSYRYSRGEKGRFLPHSISQTIKGLLTVRKYKPKLIVFRLGALPISQFIISKFGNTEYVTKTIGPKLLNVFEHESSVLYKFIRSSNKYLMTKILLGAIGNDAVSERHIKELKDALGNEVSILRSDNAVNTLRFLDISSHKAKKAKNIEKFDYIVGYAGNFPHERGGLQLIEVAPKLIEKYKKIGFVILGAGRGYDELKVRAKELNVYGNCIFTGIIPFEEVPGWINTFDLGVSFLEPKSSGASEQKIRQYLACGKPVVCSHGSSSFVEDYGLGKVSTWDDLNSIYSNICEILDMDERQKSYVRGRCRDFAQDNLSVDNATEKRLQYWNDRLSN